MKISDLQGLFKFVKAYFWCVCKLYGRKFTICTIEREMQIAESFQKLGIFIPHPAVANVN